MYTKVQSCVIALGSNDNSVFGDARETVVTAARDVAAISRAPASCSQLYATPAFPAGTGPDYVNAAIAITSETPAAELLAALHRIEAAAGRVRATRWGQRTLDIDLIAYGAAIAPDIATYNHWRNLTLAEQTRSAPQELILPHPRLQDRAFVLVPLCDIAPDWVHPVLGKTARNLCADLPAADRAAVVPIGPLDL